MGLVIEMSLSGFCSSSFLPLCSFETFAFFDFMIFAPFFGIVPWAVHPCLYASPAPMFMMVIANGMDQEERARSLNHSMQC
jgi:hypothetical protein